MVVIHVFLGEEMGEFKRVFKRGVSVCTFCSVVHHPNNNVGGGLKSTLFYFPKQTNNVHIQVQIQRDQDGI